MRDPELESEQISMVQLGLRLNSTINIAAGAIEERTPTSVEALIVSKIPRKHLFPTVETKWDFKARIWIGRVRL